MRLLLTIALPLGLALTSGTAAQDGPPPYEIRTQVYQNNAEHQAMPLGLHVKTVNQSEFEVTVTGEQPGQDVFLLVGTQQACVPIPRGCLICVGGILDVIRLKPNPENAWKLPSLAKMAPGQSLAVCLQAIAIPRDDERDLLFFGSHGLALSVKRRY